MNSRLAIGSSASFVMILATCMSGCASNGDAPSTAVADSGASSDGTSDTSDTAPMLEGGGGDDSASADAPVDATPVVTGWVSIAAPSGLDIVALSGTGANDVWAVANDARRIGNLLHYDGSAWGNVYSMGAPGKDVFAASPSAAFAISDFPGTIHRWDGWAWSVQTTLGVSSVYALWGTGASDVWLGCQWNFGAETPVRHWNGSSWSAIDTGNESGVFDLWGFGASDVWAVGTNPSSTRGSCARRPGRGRAGSRRAERGRALPFPIRSSEQRPRGNVARRDDAEEVSVPSWLRFTSEGRAPATSNAMARGRARAVRWADDTGLEMDT